MPSPGPITKLPTVPPVFQPLDSHLQQTVAEQLGDLGTSGDGFDAVFNLVMAALAADDAIGLINDTDLVASLFTAGVFQQGNLDPLAADIATFQAGGDAVINGPTTPPPTGGGGGGGGGGGSGGGGGGGGGGGLPQQCGYPPNTVITQDDKDSQVQAITDEMGLVADQLERLGC
jgi:hypothetical protein